MRGLIALCVIAFCAGLGVIVGHRMSSEAMAVVVGVVCGVLAGIPTAVLILILMRTQRRQGPGAGLAQPQAQHYPPVIVVNPGGQQHPSDGIRASLSTAYSPADAVDGDWQSLGAPARQFRVIGEDS